MGLLLQGTSDEIALLIAEFALLDAPIAAMAAAVDAGEAARIPGAELARLAADVPDLRSRLGIRCAPIRAACFGPAQHHSGSCSPLSPMGCKWCPSQREADDHSCAMGSGVTHTQATPNVAPG